MNGYMDRQKRLMDETAAVAERVTRQYDLDTWQVALHTAGIGYKRILEITAIWETVRREFGASLGGGAENDVARDHLDKALRDIAKGKQEIIPFEQRYPELRQVRYGRRR